MPAIRVVLTVLLALVAGATLAALPHAAYADAPASVDARQTWQMLDYIAVDYPEAVSGGVVTNPGEYAEMQEFSALVSAQLATLTGDGAHPQLVPAAEELRAAIEARQDPAEVGRLANALAAQVLQAFAIESTPAATPALAAAPALYAQHCASCHGAGGGGDGPAAPALDPPPIDFTDAARAAQRSPFALYQVISQGLEGTSMMAFPQLSEGERWALALHVGSMAYSDAQRAQGERLWAEDAGMRAAVPSLAALAGSSEAELAKQMGASQARAITAYLRTAPQATAPQSSSATGSLALAASLLARSVDAYRNGDAAAARRLALSSYLDGVEPVEAVLAAQDRPLLYELEAGMAALRGEIGANAGIARVEASAAQVSGLLLRAEHALDQSQGDSTAAFVGSYTILVREGIEALLIVIGMIAFLRKANRRDAMPYVHAGWITALLAGLLTWGAATWLIAISGASREVTEGFSALLAAVVLLGVGVWMHRKSQAGRWQAYLQEKMSAAMTGRTALFLFLLAFVAVYREVFETILFFAAMWSERNSGAILGGLAAGLATLVVVAWAMLRASSRLPVGRFFAISSVVIAVLAVVLAGKGIAALQEAGWIAQSVLAVPRVEWLGLYPTWQSVAAQLLVLAVVVVAYAANTRRPREAATP